LTNNTDSEIIDGGTFKSKKANANITNVKANCQMGIGQKDFLSMTGVVSCVNSSKKQPISNQLGCGTQGTSGVTPTLAQTASTTSLNT
jgi:hypothetical protein